MSAISKLFPNKVMVLQAALYTIIGLLTPIGPGLKELSTVTVKDVVIIAVFSLVSGAAALLAFLSTNYAASKFTLIEKQPIASNDASGRGGQFDS